MGRAVDFSGRTFGDLTVTGRADSRPVGKLGKTKGYWHCRCSCGNLCEVSTDNLRCGFTRSCGHLALVAHNRADLTGRQFTRLTVIGSVEVDDPRKSMHWECRCVCGATTIVPTNNLMSGNSKSCGCLSAELAADRARQRRTHGHGNRNSLTYSSWTAMLKRCRDGRPRYGGRGITVDPRWEKFENFLADMGERPPGTTLDRIDNDGPYSPQNCRWATQLVQGNNRANNQRLTYKDRTQTIAQWAREVGLPNGVLYNRIVYLGWDIEVALTSPVQRNRRTRR